MYRTENTLEDLDFCDELNSYDSVGHAVERTQFWSIEQQYQDVDFYIIMMDDSEEDEIRKLLNSCGMSAWLEYDENMVKVG